MYLLCADRTLSSIEYVDREQHSLWGGSDCTAHQEQLSASLASPHTVFKIVAVVCFIIQEASFQSLLNNSYSFVSVNTGYMISDFNSSNRKGFALYSQPCTVPT